MSDMEDMLKRMSGSKSISEVSGVPVKSNNSRMCFPKQERKQEEQLLISDFDITQATMQLAYIRAAIAVCQTSKEIAVEIHIAGLQPIGISENFQVIELLRYEEEQIEKYLRGEPNTYE